MTELIYAVRRGKLEDVLRAIKTLNKTQDTDWLNAPDGHGITSLGWAIKHNNIEIIKVLLEAHANPDLGVTLGETFLDQSCLELALEHQNPTIIKHLLDQGANPYFGKPSSEELLLGQIAVPLHKASSQSEFATINLLIDASPLVINLDAERLKYKIQRNYHLSTGDKQALVSKINKIANILNKPRRVIVENPQEFIAFIKSAILNPIHYDKILECVTDALMFTKDFNIKHRLCQFIGEIGEHYQQTYLSSNKEDIRSLARSYEVWAKIISEALPYYIQLMKKSFTKIGAEHFDILLENLKVPPEVLDDHEHKNQFLALYGKIYHEKYRHSDKMDAKSLANACLKWSQIGSPDQLTNDENLLLGELMHVAREDNLLSLCYSIMDCYQREMSMMLHVCSAAGIFKKNDMEQSVSDEALFARRLLCEVMGVPDTAFDVQEFRNNFDNKLHEMYRASTELKEIGWYELNKIMRHFLSFLVKIDKFGGHNQEYILFQKFALLKLEAELEMDLYKRNEKIKAMLEIINESLKMEAERQKNVGFIKKLFMNSIDKNYIKLLAEIQSIILNIQDCLSKLILSLPKAA